MTDLHTHILPGMDDGAQNPQISLEMLRMEQKQGVDTVVLTPHFYREQERPARFLERRDKAAEALMQALRALPEEKRGLYPRLCIGAEVAWVPNMADWDELGQLCIGAGKFLLVELPFTRWNDYMVRQLYDLPGRRGITPVIAHLERYYGVQRPEMIREILGVGLPIQLSSSTLLHPLRRGRSLKLIKDGIAHILASDCHNLDSRKADLGPALAVVEKKLGTAVRRRLVQQSDYLVEDVDFLIPHEGGTTIK